MNPNDRNRPQGAPRDERNFEDVDSPEYRPSKSDEELQREGNLGNERNRNRPDYDESSPRNPDDLMR
jgi:hypothetical protein